MSTIAIITAGGIGSRTHQDIPKQFLFVEDRPIIIYTLERFQKSTEIDKIYVACLDGWENVLEAYARQYNITKLCGIVSGGTNRTNSIKNVVEYMAPYTDDNDIVMTFDANRPLITEEMITDSIEKCKKYGAAAGAKMCYDTMFRADNKTSMVLNSENRDELFCGTGPDSTNFNTLKSIVAKYYDLDKPYTVAEMLIKSGYKVAISVSSSKCIKLTTTEDIELMRAMLKTEKYSWLK